MLELKKINLSTGNQQVLTDICVTFEKGKIYGLLGPNGSGKTTLFKTILELTKYTEEIHSLDTEKYGMLIEYPGFYENLTIIENMKLHAKYLHVKDSESIKEILEKIDLWEKKDKKISQLSLGMKQKLGIARAFLGHPTVVLLDEPTNGLDPIAIKEIRKLIRNSLINKDNCIVISSHNLSEMTAMADELIFIKDGKIVKSMKNEGLDGEKLEEIYEEVIRGGNNEKFN